MEVGIASLGESDDACLLAGARSLGETVWELEPSCELVVQSVSRMPIICIDGEISSAICGDDDAVL